ncbi:uncharacterized protein LOC143284039 isoform X2 [Babylonia areolata]|uniref:uncharacterized protein LOC143284039 isoform X2 n=1 Tax=Babylonia areolata TaxID=304850 RepID=UPI003FD685BF
MLQRVWGWRCGLLQVLVMLSSAVAADNVYRLVPPEVYVVFGGDLEVVFHVPGDVSLPNAFVRLEGRIPRDESWVEITTMGLPLGRKTGTLSAACGIVEFAGRYSLTMYLQVDGPVLAEVTFSAVWPSVLLRLPTSHYALMSAVSMSIDSSAACSSKLHRHFLTLELYFQRVVEEVEGEGRKAGGGSSFAKLSSSVRVAAGNFSSLGKANVRWNYACRLFDLDGFYQALLRSSTGTTVSVSNVMSVTFSASYHLSSRRASVFPCPWGGTLDVLYTHPACSGVDKFRVYRLGRKADGSAASPLERAYITEVDSNPDRSRMAFNCSLFLEEEEGEGAGQEGGGKAMGYCFVYVSVSKSGAVVEQRQLCLPSQPDADGGWSQWTTWTACSVTCGTGKRSRFRMCNNPLPQFGGRYCPGHAVQWSHCQVDCPDTLPRTPLRSPATLDRGCRCGCTHRANDSRGRIVASGRCKGLAVWVIRAPPGRHVTLTFRYYDVSYERQWVKVRDGEREADDLLFYSRSQSPPPPDVTSTSNVMRVELMTEVIVTSPAQSAVFPYNASLPIHIRGFIASYEATEPDTPLERPPVLFRHEEPRVMESGVAIVGMGVCGLVVVVLVVFALVQRRYWRRVPKYSAANADSPAHVSSAQSSSQPSSPGPHVQVDMDIPLTGGSGARRKSSSAGQRAASRASSISSTCSAGLKKIRSRAENLAGDGGGAVSGAGCGGSPKPSTKDYSSLGSPPYSSNASPEDGLHDANFFRASPILKHVAPRSPKVHPHRLKTSSSPATTPGSPAPPSTITKHEMLTRKRQERKGLSSTTTTTTPAGDVDGEREVTGSSGSAGSTAKGSVVGPERAAGAATTKAEIHLAKPPSSSAACNSTANRRPSAAESKCAKGGAAKRQSQGEPCTEHEEIPLMDSVEELFPQQQSAADGSKKTPVCEETSFISPPAKARRPTSLTESYSADALETRGSKSRTPKSPPTVTGRPSAMEERQTLLPKPDGQSPKTPREELVVVGEREEKRSKDSSSPSKSSLGGRSNKTMSPTRSIATPELEYDDFIMDDPLSYFEYEDLSRLNWTGTEKIGRTRRREET